MVPAGVGPGMPFHVNINGQLLRLVCPANARAGQPMRFWAAVPGSRPPQQSPAHHRQLASLERELSNELAGHDQRQAALRSFAIDGLTEDEQLQMAMAESRANMPPPPATANDAALAQALQEEINR